MAASSLIELSKMEFRSEFIKATKVLVLVCLVSYAFQYFFGNRFTWSEIKDWTINNVLFSYPFYFSNLYIVKLLNKKFSWQPNPLRRGLIATVITIGINLIVIYLVIGTVSYLVHDGPFNYALTRDGKWSVLICLTIVIIVTLIFYSIGFFKEVQSERLLNETLRRDKVTAELNALKAQVDPHFLFNSFNVLSGLIDEDPSAAQDFLSGLSKIYRYVLENRNEDLVELSQELNFAEKYMDLHKIRFEDSIKMRINVDAQHLDKKVPALSLQLLLENVIKHNAFDRDEPLVLEIKSVDNKIEVTNTKKKRTRLASNNGIGLDNIKQRYALHQIDGFEYTDSADSFNVKLPLI